jgi:hypothetical protein
MTCNKITLHGPLDVTEEDPSVAAEHLDHCIHSIRQSLECHADISTIVWGKAQNDDGEWYNAAFADTTHTCRNIDSIRDWARERTIHGKFEHDVVLPDDDIRIPTYPGR